MKLFKRLLAAALAGVLALTMMVGCSGNPNADNMIPSDQIAVGDAWQKMLNQAPENGVAVNVEYSRKLSNITSTMFYSIYPSLLDKKAKDPYGIDGEYSADRDNVVKAVFEKAKKDGTIPANSVLKVGYLATNPMSVSSYDYKAFYTQEGFGEANKIGIVCLNDRLMMIVAYIPETSK